jgi:hypothetical protein
MCVERERREDAAARVTFGEWQRRVELRRRAMHVQDDAAGGERGDRVLTSARCQNCFGEEGETETHDQSMLARRLRMVANGTAFRRFKPTRKS